MRIQFFFFYYPSRSFQTSHSYHNTYFIDLEKLINIINQKDDRLYYSSYINNFVIFISQPPILFVV